jgi:hypothetical protein
LSFGDEAEEDEIDLDSVVQVNLFVIIFKKQNKKICLKLKTLKNKPKSAHDTGDPLLSSKKATEIYEEKKEKEKKVEDELPSNCQEIEMNEEEREIKSKNLDEIKSKLEKPQFDKEKKKQVIKANEEDDKS